MQTNSGELEVKLEGAGREIMMARVGLEGVWSRGECHQNPLYEILQELIRILIKNYVQKYHRF